MQSQPITDTLPSPSPTLEIPELISGVYSSRLCEKHKVFFIGPIANLKGHYFQPSLSVSLSVCLSVCVSLTGTSTLQR